MFLWNKEFFSEVFGDNIEESRPQLKIANVVYLNFTGLIVVKETNGKQFSM